MSGERRRYLRVLFEETIQVETEDWTDSMATGLDISLNGTRFHCEHSLSEGSQVSIQFRPSLKIVGVVRWCWPIEWYYQAAVEFSDISEEEQGLLKDYISDTTGEPYPEYSEEEEEEEEEETEAVLDEVDFGEDDTLFDNDKFLDSVESTEFNGTLTPLAFADKQIIIVDDDRERIETISEYLSKRNQFTIDSTDKLSRLWPLLKAKPADLILLSWTIENGEGIGSLQAIKQRFPDTPIIFLSGSVSLEDRLGGINEGAIDFISRPVTLSTISQSILQGLVHSTNINDNESDGDSLTLGDGDEIELGDDFMTDDFMEDDLEL